MREIIDFLRELQQNNNRVWFNEHKADYLHVQARFNSFVDELIKELALFDTSIVGLQAKDCVYRIYRDTRFSADKTPYKIHMGAFICPGGKKSGFSGYYFHVGTGGSGYPYEHLLATGDYCFQPEVLRILREDIAYGDGDFERKVKSAAPEFRMDFSDSLKKNPKGYPAGVPYEMYIRLRSYCLLHTPTDEFLCSDGLAYRVAQLFKRTTPFLEFLNRAVLYEREIKK